jgi:hypothetical protein
MHAHHNPMKPYRGGRSGRYRPRLARRAPHHIPEEKFNQLFTALGSHRDRALVAFWLSTGALASELLGATGRDAGPRQQLIAVIRKGTRHLQQLPASPDAFVWLPLYQAQLRGLGPGRAGRPAVVDAAPPVPPAELSRGLPEVRPGQRHAWRQLVPARPAAHRSHPVSTTRACHWPTCNGSLATPSWPPPSGI